MPVPLGRARSTDPASPRASGSLVSTGYHPRPIDDGYRGEMDAGVRERGWDEGQSGAVGDRLDTGVAEPKQPDGRGQGRLCGNCSAPLDLDWTATSRTGGCARSATLYKQVILIRFEPMRSRPLDTVEWGSEPVPAARGPILEPAVRSAAHTRQVHASRVEMMCQSCRDGPGPERPLRCPHAIHHVTKSAEPQPSRRRPIRSHHSPEPAANRRHGRRPVNLDPDPEVTVLAPLGRGGHLDGNGV